MRILTLLAVFSSLGAALQPLQAGIEFVETTVKVDAKLTEDKVPVNFKFKVTGNKPVKLMDFEIGCKCLKAYAAKAEYQPGEEGTLEAIMEMGTLEGQVTKMLTVVTDDPANPRTELTTVVNVPQIYKIEPNVVKWDIGGPADPKVIHIKINHTDPILITKLSCTRPTVDLDIKVIKPGVEYQITIKPQSTAQPELGLITVETDCKLPRFRVRQLFYNISQPKGAPPRLMPPPPAPAN
jgi:hypothetical protein